MAFSPGANAGRFSQIRCPRPHQRKIIHRIEVKSRRQSTCRAYACDGPTANPGLGWDLLQQAERLFGVPLAPVVSWRSTSTPIPMNDEGILRNIADADRVAPFQPWAKALYEYRQRNLLKDDPFLHCLPPGGPRQFQTPHGFQFVEQRELGRILVLVRGETVTGESYILMDASKVSRKKRFALITALRLAIGRRTRLVCRRGRLQREVLVW